MIASFQALLLTIAFRIVLYTNTLTFITFLFFEALALSSVGFAIMLSTLFSRSRNGLIIGCAAYFGSYLVTGV